MPVPAPSSAVQRGEQGCPLLAQRGGAGTGTPFIPCINSTVEIAGARREGVLAGPVPPSSAHDHCRLVIHSSTVNSREVLNEFESVFDADSEVQGIGRRQGLTGNN